MYCGRSHYVNCAEGANKDTNLSLLLVAVIIVNLYLNFMTSFGFAIKFFDGTAQFDINEVIDMYDYTLKR